MSAQNTESDPELEQKVKGAYSDDKGKTIVHLPNFAGGFYNFGFWAEPISSPITLEQRQAASEALYQVVLKNLEIQIDDDVLELGCGSGAGTHLALAYKPNSVTGVDLTPEQIQRAKETFGDAAKLQFKQGNASTLTKLFSRHSFDRVFSVEAAQHFADIARVIEQLRMVVKPGGRIVIAAHLSQSKEDYQALHDKNLLVKEGINNLHPISVVLGKLSKTPGFQSIRCHRIGKHVFPGYEAWISQEEKTKAVTPWSHKLWQAYQARHIDYYLITVDVSPAPSPRPSRRVARL